MFLSSVLFKASDIVSAKNADEQCTKIAERAGLRNKTFRAWISDGTTSPSARFVRSATRFDGTAAEMSPCAGWTQASSSPVTIGRAGAVDQAWTQSPEAASCAGKARLYCFEQ